MKRILLPLETDEDRELRNNITVKILKDNEYVDTKLSDLFKPNEDETWLENTLFWTKEYIKDFWNWVRYDIPYFIINVYHWIKLVYGIRYWSHTKLLELELQWCKRALIYYTKHEMYEGQWEIRRNLRWMISLLEILINDSDSPDTLINISNSHRFMESYFMNKLKVDGPTWVFKSELRYRKVLSLYNKLRYYKLPRI